MESINCNVWFRFLSRSPGVNPAPRKTYTAYTGALVPRRNSEVRVLISLVRVSVGQLVLHRVHQKEALIRTRQVPTVLRSLELSDRGTPGHDSVLSVTSPSISGMSGSLQPRWHQSPPERIKGHIDITKFRNRVHRMGQAVLPIVTSGSQINVWNVAVR